jgi:RecG-like helicase
VHGLPITFNPDGTTSVGKTVLAIRRVLQLAEQGKKVLFLCFNQLLAKHVSESIKENFQNYESIIKISWQLPPSQG